MSKREIPGIQICAWLFAGLTAPLAIIAAGCDWVYVLKASIICGLASWWTCSVSSGLQPGKWILTAQLIWLSIILGLMNRWVDEGWPMGESYPTVPITLTMLAAASASKGSNKASTIGGILIRIMAILYAVMLLSGLGDWSAENIKPAGCKDDRLILILLLTALIIYLPRKSKEQQGLLLVATGLFALVVCILVTGGMSVAVSGAIANPFHEWVRGIEVGGIAKRFEAVASAGLILGWFCLLSYLLCVAASIGERIVGGQGRIIMWCCAIISIASTFAEAWIHENTAVVGCIVAWIAVPIICSAYEKIKMKKTRKSA